MRTLTRSLAAALLLSAPAAAAPPDPATLFPPGTLAYAEVVDPAALAPDLAALVKGTALEDSIPFVHARKDAAKTLFDLGGSRHLALVGLLASPELAGEFKNVRLAAGLVGYTPNGEPEAYLVALTADSPAAGLAARAYVTLTPTLRKVGEVGKVPVFQHRTPNVNYDNDGVPKLDKDRPQAEGGHEPTVAYTPGLFVLGSSKTAVGHALRRFAGEDKDGGLARSAAFAAAAAAHRKPGLFFFVDYPEFTARTDAAGKARGAPAGVGEWLGVDPVAWFNLAANPKAVRAVAGSVRFRDGGVAATVSATLDPAVKSPFADFLAGPGVKVEMLHHARRPAGYALAVTFPEKDRAAAVLGFLDALAKAGGELGRLPGEAVRELEQQSKIPVSDALIGKTTGATVFLPAAQELPKGAKPLPTVVLHLADGDAAAAWEDFLPKLVGHLSGAAAPQPSTEVVGGVKVFSVSAAGLPPNAPVHYARKGSVLAVGLDRKVVAAAVAADPAASVAGGDRAVAPPAGAAAFGVVSLGRVAAGVFDPPPAAGPVVPRDEPIILRNGNPLPESFRDEVKKARAGFAAAVGGLPPATVAATRAGAEVRLEVFQPGVQNGGLKAVVDAGAVWLEKAGGLAGADRRNRGVWNDLELLPGFGR
ncbi:MAG: hypothetical protein C0501_10835 [Isosphaera sp.]|nr:hypothetical protein [Isosphaera sp.]